MVRHGSYISIKLLFKTKPRGPHMGCWHRPRPPDTSLGTQADSRCGEVPQVKAGAACHHGVAQGRGEGVGKRQEGRRPPRLTVPSTYKPQAICILAPWGQAP